MDEYKPLSHGDGVSVWGGNAGKPEARETISCAGNAGRVIGSGGVTIRRLSDVGRCRSTL